MSQAQAIKIEETVDLEPNAEPKKARQIKTKSEIAAAPERQLFRPEILHLEPTGNPAYRNYLVATAKLNADIDGFLEILHLHAAIAEELARRGAPCQRIDELVGEVKAWGDTFGDMLHQRIG